MHATMILQTLDPHSEGQRARLLSLSLVKRKVAGAVCCHIVQGERNGHLQRVGVISIILKFRCR